MTHFIARWASGRVVTFRSLSWEEFRKYKQQLQYRRPGEVFLDLYRAVVLEGPADKHLTAGIVDWVAHALLDENPFGGNFEDVARALSMKREELARDYFMPARAVICSLFHIPIPELDKMDAEEFFEYVAMAEFVSGRKLTPGDPNRKDKRGKPRQARELTDRQRIALENMRKRDGGPVPASESISDPEVQDEAPRLVRPMTNAQQIVAERMRRR